MKIKFGFIVLILLPLAAWGQDGMIQYTNHVHSILMSLAGKKVPHQLALGTTQFIAVHGHHARVQMGSMVMLFNLQKQEVSWLNPVQKTYTKLPIAHLFAMLHQALAKVEAQKPSAGQAALKNMRIHTELSRIAAHPARILGIPVIERKLMMTMAMPLPARPGTPTPPAAMASGLDMRMVMRFWFARQDAVAAHPALASLERISRASARLFDPTSLLAGLPGLPPEFTQITHIYAQLAKQQTVMLRMQMKFYSPMLTMLLPMILQREHKPLPAGFDPNGPIMSMTSSATKLSSRPLPAALFQIPAGYHAVAFPPQKLPGFSSPQPPAAAAHGMLEKS